MVLLVGTLKEVSQEHCTKQPKQVDTITEEAPILETMQFAPATDTIWHNYEEVTDVQGAGWVDMNAPLPAVDVASDLKKVDLAILGGEIEVPQDRAVSMGGRDKYFAKKLPKIQRDSGQSAEVGIIYGNMIPYAKKHKKVTDCGGTGDGYSMVAVTYTEDEMTGLYSPAGFKMGAIMDAQHISGGDLYKATSGKFEGTLVYGLALKAYLGLLLANPKKIAVLANITKDKRPTAMMIDDLLADCRASTKSKTFIYCHPKCQTLLYEHKGKSMHTTVDTKDVNRAFTHWNGKEIITSFNFTDGADQHIDL